MANQLAGDLCGYRKGLWESKADPLATQPEVTFRREQLHPTDSRRECAQSLVTGRDQHLVTRYSRLYPTPAGRGFR